MVIILIVTETAIIRVTGHRDQVMLVLTIEGGA